MVEKVIGLIPAAGKGLRLGLPYPKELYPIINNNKYKPVAQFILENLTIANVNHICFVINETKHQLLGYFGNGKKFNCNFSYVVQENTDDQLSKSPGLAQAIDSAYHLIRNDTVFFGMPDTIIFPKNAFEILRNKFNEDTDILLGLFNTSTPEKFGMVDIDDNQNVTQIIDKPKKTTLKMMWGCIVWSPKFTDLIHKSINNSEYDFANILNLAIKNQLVIKGHRFPTGNFIDLGTYSELVKLEQQFRDFSNYSLG
jgi:glucose-1-phosphate thymidylyltransferase